MDVFSGRAMILTHVKPRRREAFRNGGLSDHLCVFAALREIAFPYSTLFGRRILTVG